MRIADIIAAIAVATVLAAPMVMAQSVNSGSGAAVEARPYGTQCTGSTVTTAPIAPVSAFNCG
jgi:hypothetical protein